MSFRYRERTVVDGEAIDPYDLNENVNALVGELNGKLDRDNLPERAISENMIKNQVFNIINQETKTGNTDMIDSDGNTIATNFDVHEVTYDFEEDGVLTVHIGGMTSRPNNSFAVSGVAMSQGDTLLNITCVVNGQVIANVRKISDNFQDYGFYAVGTAVVVAGSTTIKIRARLTTDSALATDFVRFKQVSITSVFKRR